MIMRLTGIGSQYIGAFVDSNGEYFDGGKTYKVTLPPNIPAEKFWSLTVYDNQTRSMLDTPQRYPRAGSQSYPTPAAEANADGSTTVYFGPSKPAGIKRRQLDSDRSRKGLEHDPAPLQPARTVLHQGVAAERDRACQLMDRKVHDTFHHSGCGPARAVARLVSKQPRGTVAPRRISLCLGKCAGSPALTCQIARLAGHWGTSVKYSWGVE